MRTLLKNLSKNFFGGIGGRFIFILIIFFLYFSFFLSIIEYEYSYRHLDPDYGHADAFRGFLFWKNFILLIIFFPVPLAIILFLWIRNSQFQKNTPELSIDWANYLKGLNDSEKYVLILRPFGYDGTIILGKRSLISFPATRPLENILSRVSGKFGCSVASVRYKNQSLNLSGQRYIDVGGIWKPAVSDLIKRAFVVVFIFPPKSELTPSVEWEINECLKKGLLGRLVFIFPPVCERDQEMTNNYIAKLLRKLHTVYRKEAENTVVIFPKQSRTEVKLDPSVKANAWYSRKPVTAYSYERCFQDIMDSVELTTSNMPFWKLYPHYPKGLYRN